MRLTPQAIEIIRQTVRAELGDGAQVRVFGSRTDDLAVESQQVVHGRDSGHGRLLAPGVRRQPIDDVALNQGVLL